MCLGFCLSGLKMAVVFHTVVSCRSCRNMKVNGPRSAGAWVPTGAQEGGSSRVIVMVVREQLLVKLPFNNRVYATALVTWRNTFNAGTQNRPFGALRRAIMLRHYQKHNWRVVLSLCIFENFVLISMATIHLCKAWVGPSLHFDVQLPLHPRLPYSDPSD